jgi:hypothetical protein
VSKLTRQTMLCFGLNAGGADMGVFGSLAAGSPTYSSVIATIQSLAAWGSGWAAETIATNRPALEDMNGVCHVLSYGVCYLHEMGIPEWDAGTTYYINSYCQLNGTVYYSIQDNNINQGPDTATTYWTSGLKGLSAIPNTTYDTGWFAANHNTSYTKTHGLGTTKIIAMMWFSASADGSNAVSNFTHIYTAVGGSQLKSLTTTQVTLMTGREYLVDMADASTPITDGYARIVMLALP